MGIPDRTPDRKMVWLREGSPPIPPARNAPIGPSGHRYGARKRMPAWYRALEPVRARYSLASRMGTGRDDLSGMRRAFRANG